MDLFSDIPGQVKTTNLNHCIHSKGDQGKHQFDLEKGQILYLPEFLDQRETKAYLQNFLQNQNPLPDDPLAFNPPNERLHTQKWKNIAWRRDEVFLFGKRYLTPRLTAWYGDADASYSYSNNQLKPMPWSPELLRLKQKIETVSPRGYNSVLLNWYRNGDDHMGWHSDDEKELGQNPEIASLNLGASRRFVLRLKTDHSQKIEFNLNNGDLLLMKGALQHHWQHYVPKQKKVNQGRINLTFRRIVSKAVT